MLNRAYSLLEIKSIDEDRREIEGIATTPEMDSMGDIVESDGADYKLPIPLLWQHDAGQPIGEVFYARKTSAGIQIRARLARIDAPGSLSERLDEAWQSLKSGLVKGLSIGFRALEYAIMEDTGGYRFTKWRWLELSAVTIPANQEATITAVKSCDSRFLAASGVKQNGIADIKTQPAAAAGKTITNKQIALTPKKEGRKMDKILEQIQQFQAERKVKTDRMAEIMQKSADDAQSLDDATGEEYDTLKDEVKSIDVHLGRLKDLQDMQVQTKADAGTAVTQKAGAGSRAAAEARHAQGPTVFVRTEKEDAFAGQAFTRRVIAQILGHLNHVPASNIAEARWGKSNPMLVEWIKANEVAAGGTGSGDWGHELVGVNGQYTGDFVEYLYGQTVFGKLPLRVVPANVTIKGQDGAATANWVGENKAIPMSKPDFSDVTLTPLKIAALTAMSNELVKYSSPDAEMLVRDALVNACAQKIDTTFLSTSAASAGVSPAGILNGLGATTSHGETAEALRADIKTLYAPFLAAKNATGLAFVMSPTLAKSISLMRNTFGQQEFPGLTAAGGTLEGDPVYVSDNVTTGQLILLKPSDIWKIGETGVEVSISRDATIEQNSSPSGAGDTPTASGNTLVSLWQTEQTGIKAVMPVNFQKRRTSAVAYITGADYGTDESAS